MGIRVVFQTFEEGQERSDLIGWIPEGMASALKGLLMIY